MGIFDILIHNSTSRSRTLLPADAVSYPQGFRGKLDHDLTLCVGCQTCRYVCSPGAIRFDASQPTAITWQYLAAQCTFCGRCVDYCPTKALSFEQKSPRVGEEPRSVVQEEHAVAYQPCERCGRPIIPLPDAVAERFYLYHATPGSPDLTRLCEHCRGRENARRFKDSLSGARSTPGEKDHA